MEIQPTTKFPRIAIIGAGKVGLTIASLLSKKGHAVSAFSGRDLEKAALAVKQAAAVSVCSPEQAARSADIVLLAVSDDAIETVCNELSMRSAFCKNQVVAHFSGALTSEVLASARIKCGALLASIHPLQTFPDVDAGLASLPGAFWFCEGDEKALDSLIPVIRVLDGKPNLIPTEKKALYHAASVIACNYLVTLMDVALTTAEAAGLERESAWSALQPLLLSTIRNISSSGTANALTGPVVRGDVCTVAGHLAALESSAPDIAEIYRVLGRWTTKIAARRGLSEQLLKELYLLLGNNGVY